MVLLVGDVIRLAVERALAGACQPERPPPVIGEPSDREPVALEHNGGRKEFETALGLATQPAQRAAFREWYRAATGR